jgi:hypothetical protein
MWKRLETWGTRYHIYIDIKLDRFFALGHWAKTLGLRAMVFSQGPPTGITIYIFLKVPFGSSMMSLCIALRVVFTLRCSRGTSGDCGAVVVHELLGVSWRNKSSLIIFHKSRISSSRFIKLNIDHPGFDQLQEISLPWHHWCFVRISWVLTSLTMASSSFSMATCVKSSWVQQGLHADPTYFVMKTSFPIFMMIPLKCIPQ